MAVTTEAAIPTALDIERLLPLRAAAVFADRCGQRAAAVLARGWPAPVPGANSTEWGWHMHLARHLATDARTHGTQAKSDIEAVLNYGHSNEKARKSNAKLFYEYSSEVSQNTFLALKHAREADQWGGNLPGGVPSESLFHAAIWADINSLTRVGAEAWTDAKPIPPHPLGPLWPDELAEQLPEVAAATSWLFKTIGDYTPKPALAWSLVAPASVGYPIAVRVEVSVAEWGHQSAHEFTWDELRREPFLRVSLSSTWQEVLAAHQQDIFRRVSSLAGRAG